MPSRASNKTTKGDCLNHGHEEASVSEAGKQERGQAELRASIPGKSRSHMASTRSTMSALPVS